MQIIYYSTTPATDAAAAASDLELYNETSFNINVGESVVIIIRNTQCLSFRIKYCENKFLRPFQELFQNGLWIMNVSTDTSLHVEENTPLSSLLAQAEICYKHCHMSVSDLLQQSLNKHNTDDENIVKKTIIE